MKTVPVGTALGLQADLDFVAQRARLGNDLLALEVDLRAGLRLAHLRDFVAGRDWIPQPATIPGRSESPYATLNAVQVGDLWPNLAPPSNEFLVRVAPREPAAPTPNPAAADPTAAMIASTATRAGADTGLLTGGSPATLVPDRCRAVVENGVALLELTIALTDQPLAVTVHSEVRAGLPLVRRWVTVRNTGSAPVRLQEVLSLVLSVRAASPADLDLYWVEAFHHPSVELAGVRWRQATVHQERLGPGTRRTLRYGPYPRPHDGSQGCLAWAALRDPVCAAGLIVGWEWSGLFDAQIGDFAEGAGVFGVRAGFSSEGGYWRDLAPGATFTSPKAFVGFFQGDVEAAGRVTRAITEKLFALPWPDGQPPMFVGYDTWCNWQDFQGMTHHLKPDRLAPEIARAAQLGVELFILDYDWFPLLGDWRSDPQRFPNGVEAIAAQVKAAGMKFGLWMGFGQAHQDAPVVREHPDWLVTKHGQPVAGGWGMRSLCLGYPPCRDWALEQVSGIVERFGVDWLKHDFDLIPLSDAPHHAPDAADSRLETVLGYYHILEELHRRFPRLYLDNWTPATGGADFGNFQRHHSTLMADWYTPLTLRSMLHGIGYLVPYNRTHAYWRSFTPAEERAPYGWRSAFFGNGVYLLNDILAWDETTQAIARAEIARLKQDRVCFRDGEVYNLLAKQPDHYGWEARFVYSSSLRAGVAQVFRNHDPQPQQQIVFCGLDPQTRYNVAVLDAGHQSLRTGAELQTTGLSVVLAQPFSSEIVRVRAAE